MVRNSLFSLFVLWASVSYANQPRVAAAEPGDGDIIAVVNYQGGFQQDLSGTVLTKSIVKYFRVDVPAFCGPVEVLSASTVSEGVMDPAKAVGKNMFEVAGGSGLRISTVALTLNGPPSATCSIPIFARTSGGGWTTNPGAGVVNQNVHFCSKYGTPIRIALAYQNESGFVTQGWYRIQPGECVNVETASPLKNIFYSYAYSEQAVPIQWGTEKYFCVSSKSPFLVTNDDCQAGTPFTRLQLFSSHPINEKAIMTVTYR